MIVRLKPDAAVSDNHQQRSVNVTDCLILSLLALFKYNEQR